MIDEIESFWAADGGMMIVSVLNSVVQHTDNINLLRTQYLNGVRLNCLSQMVGLLLDSRAGYIQFGFWRMCQYLGFSIRTKFAAAHSNQIRICRWSLIVY